MGSLFEVALILTGRVLQNQTAELFLNERQDEVNQAMGISL